MTREKLEKKKQELLKTKEQLEKTIPQIQDAWQRTVGQLQLIDELLKEDSSEKPNG